MRHRLLLVFVVGGIVSVLAWLGFQTYQEFRRGQAVQREIDQLEQEGSRIRQENVSLKDNIEYFKTSDFQEREAREKLNYRANGERLVVIQSAASASAPQVAFSENSDSTRTIVFRKPNYRLWWEQFFDF